MYSYCAFVIGMISGVVYSFVAKLVEGKRLDDPLDAIAGIVLDIQLEVVKVT